MRQLVSFYRWGNDTRSFGPFLGFLVLAGLVCVAVGAGIGIPEILIAGLVIILFMVPVIYLREKAIDWIRGRLSGGSKQK